MSIEEIAGQFITRGNIESVRPCGRGHINDNYQVTVSGQQEPGYFLQRINRQVFRDVDLLMNNLMCVCSHLGKKIREAHPEDFRRRTVELVPAGNGESYLKDAGGSCWRMTNYIENHRVYDRCEDPLMAFEGARMFGNFIRMLSDLSPTLIGETIPRFHDLSLRISRLRKSYRDNPAGRASEIQTEIRYVESAAGLMSTVQDLGRQKIIPLRITHNDTKINNVLFDADRKGLCVVDLDTVMPGYVHYDFGDGIRTFTNTGEEDSQDPGLVSMDMDKYRAFAAGFLEGTGRLLSREERESLHFAGILFPFIMGIRFLTDYLEGDRYFKTSFAGHNLVRARAQFRLAQDGTKKLDEARRIIGEVS